MNTLFYISIHFISVVVFLQLSNFTPLLSSHDSVPSPTMESTFLTLIFKTCSLSFIIKPIYYQCKIAAIIIKNENFKMHHHKKQQSNRSPQLGLFDKVI